MDERAAMEHLQAFFEVSVADNMFDLHPPFQIDGNFGVAAGMAELLLQSHEGFLRILPALPDAWDQGQVKGLMARNGFEVDIQWEAGLLQELTIHSKLGKPLEIHYDGTKKMINLPKGGTVTLNAALETL
jgi:alpha-L-fucosidase 2